MVGHAVGGCYNKGSGMKGRVAPDTEVQIMLPQQ